MVVVYRNGKVQLKSLKEIFTKSNGVLFSHSFIERRKKIFRVERFEKLFAKKIGAKYAIACSSGTAAGSLCLLAAGVKPGDEVITQAFTILKENRRKNSKKCLKTEDSANWKAQFGLCLMLSILHEILPVSYTHLTLPTKA